MRKYIIFITIFLSGCCNEVTQEDCTVSEIERIKAETHPEPIFVTNQDNVKVYKIWTKEPYASSHWTYFTTPCGDTSAIIEYRVGKSSTSLQENIKGSGCK